MIEGYSIVDGRDPSKRIKFNVSNIGSQTTRILTVPDTDGTIVLLPTGLSSGILAINNGVLSVLETNITGAELEELSNHSITSLHTHSSGGSGTYTSFGDLSAPHFQETDLVLNDSWQILDMSSVIGIGERLLHLRININGNNVGSRLTMRKKGHTHAWNSITVRVQQSGIPFTISDFVECDANGMVEYVVSNDISSIDINVKGYLS